MEEPNAPSSSRSRPAPPARSAAGRATWSEASARTSTTALASSMEKKRKQQASSSFVPKHQKTVSEPKKELPKTKAEAQFVDLTGSDDEDTSKDSKAEIVD